MAPVWNMKKTLLNSLDKKTKGMRSRGVDEGVIDTVRFFEEQKIEKSLNEMQDMYDVLGEMPPIRINPARAQGPLSYGQPPCLDADPIEWLKYNRACDAIEKFNKERSYQKPF